METRKPRPNEDKHGQYSVIVIDGTHRSCLALTSPRGYDKPRGYDTPDSPVRSGTQYQTRKDAASPGRQNTRVRGPSRHDWRYRLPVIRDYNINPKMGILKMAPVCIGVFVMVCESVYDSCGRKVPLVSCLSVHHSEVLLLVIYSEIDSLPMQCF